MPTSAVAGAVDPGDLTVPGSRVPTWYTAPEGGIPDTSGWTVHDVSDAADMTPLGCGTVDPAPNAGDGDYLAIQCAIDNTPVQSILHLPAGHFNITDRNGLRFRATDGQKLLRCASNTRSRIVIDADADEGETFSGCWGSRDAFLGICAQGGIGIEVPWTGGHTAGTTTISLADASGFSVGDWIYLEQDDDVAQLQCRFQNGQNGDDNWTAIHKITAKVANDLTLDRPLRNDFTNTNQTASPFTPVEQIGIENCGFEMTTLYNEQRTAAVLPTNAANVWITGNRFDGWPQMALVVQDAARVLIRGNRFENSVVDGSGNQQVHVRDGATDVVIENNAFDDADPIKIERGASGTVVAYNFWNGGDTRSAFLHGMATESLLEGNHADKQMAADNFWCSQGPRNTFYRNRLLAQEARCWSVGDDWDLGTPCTSDADCTSPDLCYDTDGSGLVSHGDDGHGFQIAPQLNVFANAATHLIGRPSCGKNAVTETTCRSFDANVSLPDVWIERNRTRGVIRLDDDAISTTDVDNRESDPTTAPPAWQLFSAPDSFYLPSTPEWWCQEACPFDLQGGIGAFGDDLARPNEGRLCKLPAQILFEGGTCTPQNLPTP